MLALLVGPGLYGPEHVERLSDGMAPVGRSLRIPFAAEVSTNGSSIAVRRYHSVAIADAATLRWTATYRLPHVGVCSAGFDGSTPVALVGCSHHSRHYAILRLDPRRWITVRDPIRTIEYPATFAYGDGKLFVAEGPDYGVVVIGLQSGAVTVRRPRRSLAKGGGFVEARWLGDHLLGLNGVAVDVRTWRAHTLSAHATELITDGTYVAAYGSNGVAVFTRPDLRLYRRFLRGQVVDQARLVDGVLYARVALIWARFDVRTGRSLGQVLLDDAEQLWLL